LASGLEMPLPRAVADDSGAVPLCFAPRRSSDGERVATRPTAPSHSASAGPASLQLTGLQEEMALMRRQLEGMSEVQMAMQAAIQDVRDLIAAGAAEAGSAANLSTSDLIKAHRACMKLGPPPSALVMGCGEERKPPSSMTKVPETCIMQHGDESPFKPGGAEERALSHDRPRPSVSMASVGSMAQEKTSLMDLFLDAEDDEQRELEKAAAKQNVLQFWKDKCRAMTMNNVETLMDSIMGAVICVNAVFIGFSMDMSTGTGVWLVIDVIFSALFLSDLVAKIAMKGVRGYFGESLRALKTSNCFDSFLVILDIMQLCLTFAGAADDTSGDLPSASLFRLIRLIKLARMLRLLRTEVFKDLLSMIQGMIGGMPTLGWSMILFFMVVYLVSLLFREAFGRKEKENVYEFFNSVPRSMFTTFRCSFGDCSTSGGMPIFEHVHNEYGAVASIFYCFFIFAITIGLFNVISAIFVESTMAAAMSLEVAKKKGRLADKRLWNTRISTLIKRLMDVSPEHSIPGRMSDNVDEIFSVDVPGKVIDLVVKDPVAIQALNDLDIDPEDHKYLSDILDPDNGGSVAISEFVDGLRRLRGDPRRSDIVTVDLMIRSMQQQIGDIQRKVTALLEDLPFPSEQDEANC